MSSYNKVISRISFRHLILTILVLVFLGACKNPFDVNSVQTKDDKSTGTFSLPSSILAATLNQNNISAYITIDNGQGSTRRDPMIISNGTAQFTTTLAPGSYTFTIEFEYNDTVYSNIPLANAVKTGINIDASGNTPVAFQQSAYSYPDEDNDQVYNIIELEQGTDPTNAADKPPLVCSTDAGVISCTNPNLIPPTISDGNLRYSLDAGDNVMISWKPAQDNVSSGSVLQYQLYISLSDNIQNVADVLANGTAFGGLGTSPQSAVLGAFVLNVYWNVLVQDESGNLSAYVSSKVGGVLDPSFYGVGYFTQNNAAGGDASDEGKSVTVDANNNILVTGSSWNGTSYDMVIWRFTKNSTGNWMLDPNFPNANGSSLGYILEDGATAVGSWDYGNAITVDKSGRILVTGYSDSTGKGAADMVIWRYAKDANNNWTLDPTFNGVGYITHDNAAGGNGWDEGKDIAVDSLGNILVTGRSANGSTYKMVLWRYSNVSGSWTLDTSFGDDDPASADPAIKLGYFVASVGYQGYSVALDPSGNIVIAGDSFGTNWDMIVWRYAPDGNGIWQLDPTFNSTGYIIGDNGGSEFGRSVTNDLAGNILVAGYGQGTYKELIVWRCAKDINGNWSLDHNFPSADGSSPGYVTFGDVTDGPNSWGYGIAVDQSNRILVTGNSLGVAVWRYAKDATNNWGLDPTFNGVGYVTSGGSNDEGDDIVLDADGNIVVAGISNLSDMAVWRYLAP